MLREQLQEDLQTYLRKRKTVEVGTLRMALSSAVNKEKEKRAKLAKENPGWGQKELEAQSRLTDEEITEVLFAEAKKRREAMIEFGKGGREDLVEREKEELEVLQRYLPKQLSEEEIREYAQKAIQELGAASLKDVGRVMAKVMEELRGRADGGKVAEIVRKLLNR